MAVAASDVTFAALTDADIAAYVATGEWQGKAGAYAIQGRASAFAEVIRGDLDTVVGLSLRTVRRLLREAGFPISPR
jgi:septum formation protein